MGEGFAQVRALYLANQDLPFRKENISVIEKKTCKKMPPSEKIRKHQRKKCPTLAICTKNLSKNMQEVETEIRY